MLDNRQDQFAGDHKGLYEDSCKRIVKEQCELETAYRLIDCTNENGRNGYDLLYIPKNKIDRGRKYLLLPFLCISCRKFYRISVRFFRFFMGIRGKIIIQIFMRRSVFSWNIHLKLSQSIPRKVISRER